MVTTFYPPYHFGGDAVYIYRLTNELARNGHRVDVIHCIDSYKLFRSLPSSANYPNHPNVRMIPLKSRAGFLSPLSTQQTGIPFFKKDLKARLETTHYDVIHYHNMSLIGITAVRYGNAVKLYTMHEHWLICPMHVLWRFNREVCTHRTCIRCQILGRRPPQLWRYAGLLERMFPYIDAFISPSRFTLGKHLELHPNMPITHIPYFLPTSEKIEEDALDRRNFSLGEPYFLFVGRLEKIKGVQNIIPVFRQLSKYSLLIAGEGNYEKELKYLAAGADNVRFLGRQSSEQLQQLYKKAIAVIVPSICYEVFGIIIIEAFAMKTPVIVNNLGALPEVVYDSNGGFVYKNDEELKQVVERLASNPELREELGNRGHDAYLRYWSEHSHLRQYLSLIESIQKKSNAPIEVS